MGWISYSWIPFSILSPVPVCLQKMHRNWIIGIHCETSSTEDLLKRLAAKDIRWGVKYIRWRCRRGLDFSRNWITRVMHVHFPSPLTQFPLKQKLLCRHFWMFTIVLHFYTLMNTILGIQLHETNRPVFSLAITSLISHCGCENNKRSPKNSDGQLKIQLKPEDNYLIFVVIRFYFDCFSSNDAFPTHISLFYQEY